MEVLFCLSLLQVWRNGEVPVVKAHWTTTSTKCSRWSLGYVWFVNRIKILNCTVAVHVGQMFLTFAFLRASFEGSLPVCPYPLCRRWSHWKMATPAAMPGCGCGFPGVQRLPSSRWLPALPRQPWHTVLLPQSQWGVSPSPHVPIRRITLQKYS